MSLAQVRTAIVTRLAAVPDIGAVHAYERYAKDLAQLRKLYHSPSHGDVRGAWVRRVSTAETGNVFERTVEHVRWRLFLVRSLDDAGQSELGFEAVIEAVRGAFRPDDALGGLVDQCSVPAGGTSSGEAGIQVEDSGPAMFTGVLCHCARLSLNTIRYLESTP